MGLIPIETFWTLVITAGITALVGAIVGGGYARVKKFGADQVAVDKAKGQALKIILEQKVNALTDEAIKAGSITTRDRAVICEMVDVAHALGANGHMTTCEKIIKQLPVKAED